MTEVLLVLSVLAAAVAGGLVLAWLRGSDVLGTLAATLAEAAERTGEAALEVWEWVRFGR